MQTVTERQQRNINTCFNKAAWTSAAQETAGLERETASSSEVCALKRLRGVSTRIMQRGRDSSTSDIGEENQEVPECLTITSQDGMGSRGGMS